MDSLFFGEGASPVFERLGQNRCPATRPAAPPPPPPPPPLPPPHPPTHLPTHSSCADLINALSQVFKKATPINRNKPLLGFLPRKLAELYSQNRGGKELICLLMTLRAALDWPEKEAPTKPHKRLLDPACDIIDKAIKALPERWRLQLDDCTSKLKADANQVFQKLSKHYPEDIKPVQVAQLLASIIIVKRPAPPVVPRPPPAATLRATVPPPSPAPSSGTASLPLTSDSGDAASLIASSPPPSIADSSEESEGERGGSPPLLSAVTAAEDTGAELIASAVGSSGDGGGPRTDAADAAAAAEAAAAEEKMKRAEVDRDNERARQEKLQRRAAAPRDSSGSSRSSSGGSTVPLAAATSSAFRFDFYSNDVERALLALDCTSGWLGFLSDLKSFTNAPTVEELSSHLGVREIMCHQRQLDIVKRNSSSVANSWRAIKTLLDTSGTHVRVYRLDLSHTQRVCIILNVRARIIAVYSVFSSDHKADDRRYVPSADYVHNIAQQH